MSRWSHAKQPAGLRDLPGRAPAVHGAMNDDLDAMRRVLAADVESFRRLVERYQRPLLTRQKAAKVDVMRPSSLQW